MLTYEEFYHKIWNEYISQSDVSYGYRESNAEFIKVLTFAAWKKYSSKNISEYVYAEMFKLFFSNFFLYSPETFDSGEVRDFNAS